MNRKILQFPQPPHQAEAAIDAPVIFFSLGTQRFAIQWTVTEVDHPPTAVVTIQKRPSRKRTPSQI